MTTEFLRVPPPSSPLPPRVPRRARWPMDRYFRPGSKHLGLRARDGREGLARCLQAPFLGPVVLVLRSLPE